MLWFFIAMLGYFLLSINFILDKIIVSKSVSKPVVYTFYSTIFMFVALAALPIIGFDHPIGHDWIWTAVSGIAFGLGLWTVYIALGKGEASHINPFNGAVVTIATYACASLFLNESLQGLQVVGIAVLIVASLLLSFEKSRSHNGFHIGFVWAFISGLCFAISHVSAKYLYGVYPFWTGFIWSRAFIGVVGLITLCFPAVWKSFHKKKKQESHQYARRHVVGIIIFNKVLSVVQVIVLQFAMSIGSVTVVNALSGLQYALMFVMVYLLTKFKPGIFKEYFTRREIFLEVSAIVLVGIGLFLII
ncbi:MAG: DMT family transporter [Candidatus Magasanikbacteria bacterium]